MISDDNKCIIYTEEEKGDQYMIYTISNSGSDSNNGIDKPFKTIAKALSILKDGDTFQLSSGSSFAESLSLPRVLSNFKVIAIGTGSRPTINRIYADNQGIYKNITIDGLHFKSGESEGIRWLGATDGLT